MKQQLVSGSRKRLASQRGVGTPLSAVQMARIQPNAGRGFIQGLKEFARLVKLPPTNQ